MSATLVLPLRGVSAGLEERGSETPSVTRPVDRAGSGAQGLSPCVRCPPLGSARGGSLSSPTTQLGLGSAVLSDPAQPNTPRTARTPCWAGCPTCPRPACGLHSCVCALLTRSTQPGCCWNSAREASTHQPGASAGVLVRGSSLGGLQLPSLPPSIPSVLHISWSLSDPTA